MTEIPTRTAREATTEAGAAFAAGAESVETKSWYCDEAPDMLTAVVPSGYMLKTLPLDDHLQGLRDRPRRTHGTAVMHDTPSFLAYVGKHADEHSDTCEIYGNPDASRIVALLNAPSADYPGWGDHRATLELLLTEQWRAWLSESDGFMPQEQFAGFVEEHSTDFVSPDAATMLEVAQTLNVTNNASFQSSIRLRDGQTRLQYLESMESSAGTRGDLTVPTTFTVQLQPWRGIAIGFEATCRLKTRINRNALMLGYTIDGRDGLIDAAWKKLIAQLSETLPVPVLYGNAPDYA